MTAHQLQFNISLIVYRLQDLDGEAQSGLDAQRLPVPLVDRSSIRSCDAARRQKRDDDLYISRQLRALASTDKGRVMS